MYIIWALEMGGAEKMVVSLATNLDKTKYNPLICCLNYKGRLAHQLEEKGIPVIELGKRPGFDLSIIPKLIKVMRENRVDIVHTHLWTADFWGRIAAKLAGIPIIISTAHNIDAWKPKIFLIADKILSHFSDKIIAVSNTVKSFYVKNAKIPASKIKMIYNGIDVDKFNIDIDRNIKRRELGLGIDKKVIAVIGRLVEQKGHIYFLDCLKKLSDRYTNIQALIVGDGPLKGKLEKQSMELGLDGEIIFTGVRKDIPEILKIIDILIIPSLYEGLPTIMLEAMASRVAVVSTNVGGNPEVVVDGKMGFLVHSKDSLGLADSIEKFLENVNLAEHMGAVGRERVTKYFSLSKMLKETEGLYEDLIEEKLM